MTKEPNLCGCDENQSIPKICGCREERLDFIHVAEATYEE